MNTAKYGCDQLVCKLSFVRYKYMHVLEKQRVSVIQIKNARDTRAVRVT